MDMVIIAIAAVLFSIIAAVVALVKKKAVLKVLGFALAGLVLGGLAGYCLAPTIISYM